MQLRESGAPFLTVMTAVTLPFPPQSRDTLKNLSFFLFKDRDREKEKERERDKKKHSITYHDEVLPD